MAATTIKPSQGFHFKISDNVFEQEKVIIESHCSLYVLHHFPSSVFIDPYEVAQLHQDGAFFKFQIWGEIDLELPVSAVSTQGSAMLVGPIDDKLPIEIPIHARYPRPSRNETHATISIPNPMLLTVCKGSNKGKTVEQPPLFYPFDSPFHDATVTEAQRFGIEGVLNVRVPTGNQADVAIVEPFTLISVFLAVFYIGYSIWKATLKSSPIKIKQN